MLAALERVNHLAGEAEPLVGCAGGVPVRLSLAGHGEMSRASGWLTRAERSIALAGFACVEQGLEAPARQPRELRSGAGLC